MEALLSKLRPDELISLLSILLLYATGLTVWLTYSWRMHRRTEIEAALKQDMLNRGMSADDIERVVRASAATPCTSHSDRVHR